MMKRKKSSAKYLKVSKEAAKIKPLTQRQRRERRPPAQTRIRSPDKNKGGRPVGSPNKFPRLLKDALLEAAETVGNKLAPFQKRGPAQSGLVNYLCHQAVKSPNAFMSLLGRVLPLQIESDGNGPVLIVDRIEYHVVDGRDPDGNELERELNEGSQGPLTIDGTAEVTALSPPSQIQGSTRR